MDSENFDEGGGGGGGGGMDVYPPLAVSTSNRSASAARSTTTTATTTAAAAATAAAAKGCSNSVDGVAVAADATTAITAIGATTAAANNATTASTTPVRGSNIIRNFGSGDGGDGGSRHRISGIATTADTTAAAAAAVTNGVGAAREKYEGADISDGRGFTQADSLFSEVTPKRSRRAARVAAERTKVTLMDEEERQLQEAMRLSLQDSQQQQQQQKQQDNQLAVVRDDSLPVAAGPAAVATAASQGLPASDSTTESENSAASCSEDDFILSAHQPSPSSRRRANRIPPPGGKQKLSKSKPKRLLRRRSKRIDTKAKASSSTTASSSPKRNPSPLLSSSSVSVMHRWTPAASTLPRAASRMVLRQQQHHSTDDNAYGGGGGGGGSSLVVPATATKSSAAVGQALSKALERLQSAAPDVEAQQLARRQYRVDVLRLLPGTGLPPLAKLEQNVVAAAARYKTALRRPLHNKQTWLCGRLDFKDATADLASRSTSNERGPEAVATEAALAAAAAAEAAAEGAREESSEVLVVLSDAGSASDWREDSTVPRDATAAAATANLQSPPLQTSFSQALDTVTATQADEVATQWPMDVLARPSSAIATSVTAQPLTSIMESQRDLFGGDIGADTGGDKRGGQQQPNRANTLFEQRHDPILLPRRADAMATVTDSDSTLSRNKREKEEEEEEEEEEDIMQTSARRRHQAVRKRRIIHESSDESEMAIEDNTTPSTPTPTPMPNCKRRRNAAPNTGMRTPGARTAVAPSAISLVTPPSTSLSERDGNRRDAPISPIGIELTSPHMAGTLGIATLLEEGLTPSIGQPAAYSGAYDRNSSDGSYRQPVHDLDPIQDDTQEGSPDLPPNRGGRRRRSSRFSQSPVQDIVLTATTQPLLLYPCPICTVRFTEEDMDEHIQNAHLPESEHSAPRRRRSLAVVASSVGEWSNAGDGFRSENLGSDSTTVGGIAAATATATVSDADISPEGHAGYDSDGLPLSPQKNFREVAAGDLPQLGAAAFFGTVTTDHLSSSALAKKYDGRGQGRGHSRGHGRGSSRRGTSFGGNGYGRSRGRGKKKRRYRGRKG